MNRKFKINLVILCCILILTIQVSIVEANFIDDIIEIMDKGEAITEFSEEYREELKDMLVEGEQEQEISIQTVKELVYTVNTINPEILRDLKIKIYPFKYIINGGKYTSGTASKYLGKYNIALSKNGCNRTTVYHEIGHIICYKTTGSSGGYSWDNVNENGDKYIQLKGYEINSEDELDSHRQREIPWENRIAEWFAEDARQVIETLTEAYISITRAGPKITPEVEEFIYELIMSINGQ